uniref:Uncharacterized protein n=1 Tax=Anguilla anguilla TaxID=7936 RepID=A0A0E9RCT2_ANGAN
MSHPQRIKVETPTVCPVPLV